MGNDAWGKVFSVNKRLGRGWDIIRLLKYTHFTKLLFQFAGDHQIKDVCIGLIDHSCTQVR